MSPSPRWSVLLSAALLATFSVLAVSSPTATADPTALAEPALVPRPVLAEQPADAEPYVLTPGTRLAAPRGEAGEVAKLLAEELRSATGYRLPVLTRARPGDIEIRIADDYTVDGAAPTEESYQLDASARGVTITASSAHGAFNGVQTFRQLLPAWAGSEREVRTAWEVPATHVEDAPRFGYRGVMLDVARSFQEVDEVKGYIDALARFKLSTLHLHLADDQGWRIEITNEGKDATDPIDYSRLTEISGDTAMNQPFTLNELGRTGYYTQEEYREIVAYAKERFVTIVPEVDVPSHTNAALHAIPELNTDRSLPAPDPETGVVDWNGTGDVGYSALDEQHPVTYQFVAHVFEQLADMTGGPLVHMGGDESHAMGHERYVDFVTQAVPVVREAAGTGVMGWTEYAEAGLSQGADFWEGSVLHYWVGSGDWVRDFVAKGGKTVVSSAEGAYIDMKYDPSTPIGLDWACRGDCDIDKYYNWEPTSVVEGGIAEDGVLGVEAPMWSENIRGLDQAQYMTLPRAAGILETGWSQREHKDFTSFADRLGRLGAHMTVDGTNYYETRRAQWTATAAGLDVTTRPRTTSHQVAQVAAPGTKLSADGTELVADRTTVDGDPSSNSALPEPWSADLVCGEQSLPVTFTQEQARDHTHGAGVYTGWVEHAFSSDTSCALESSTGEAQQISVDVDRRADQPEEDPDLGPPTLQIGAGGSVDEGSWVPFELSGFQPGPYIEIAVDGELAYHLRADAEGRFDRHGLIPRGLTDGEHVVTATQGERSAEVVLDVESDILPPIAVAADGTTQEIDAVNPASRTAGMLALYTPAFGDSTQTDQSGGEAVLVETETPGSYRVVQVCTALTSCANPGNNTIPDNGVVLSAAPGGDPDVRLFLRDHLEVGDVVELQNLIRTATTTVDAANPPSRGAEQLVVYTSASVRESTGTNEWGYEVTVVDGRVVGRGGNDRQIPDDGYVISGHGSRATWLSDNTVLGARVELDGSTLTVTYIAGP